MSDGADGAVIGADYLIKGGGAVGMAFADQLFTDTDTTMVIVDRPGGHWNEAYPFVRLHQPASGYGVSSLPLGSGSVDHGGLNAGFHELASGHEVVAHFDAVMRQRFLPSGRVTFLSSSEVDDDAMVTSLLSGARCRVEFGRFDHFTVVGAGKTGMDACVWLLQQGADPDQIRWIVPRDSWVLRRGNFQPGAELRHIDDIVRLGRVRSIHHDRLDLDNRPNRAGYPDLDAWHAGTRLDILSKTASERIGVDQEATAHLGRYLEHVGPARPKLDELLASVGASTTVGAPTA